MKVKLKRDHIHPAVVSVYAALIASAHMLPAIVLYGVGGTISVSAVLVPLAGVLFGPVAGCMCGAIGQFVGFLIAPSGAWLGMFTFLIGTCTSLTSGLLSRGKWPPAFCLSALGVIIWMCLPIGRPAWFKAAIFGGCGFTMCLLSALFAPKFLTSRKVHLMAFSIFTCCAAGMFTSTQLADCLSWVLNHPPLINYKAMALISPHGADLLCRCRNHYWHSLDVGSAQNWRIRWAAACR